VKSAILSASSHDVYQSCLFGIHQDSANRPLLNPPIFGDGLLIICGGIDQYGVVAHRRWAYAGLSVQCGAPPTPKNDQFIYLCRWNSRLLRYYQNWCRESAFRLFGRQTIEETPQNFLRGCRSSKPVSQQTVDATMPPKSGRGKGRQVSIPLLLERASASPRSVHGSLLSSNFGTSKRPSAIDSSTVTMSYFSSGRSGMTVKLHIYLDELL